ncbi:MAG: hypothetical protein KGJ09_10380 [Candidatus Omnitrophica bacterium]|nr:hypothetical protein [Candidatus Omnitrophota bacterium]MDE2215109.1 hypothetical protein [Candidatus Omnitrophota bacterium]
MKSMTNIKTVLTVTFFIFAFCVSALPARADQPDAYKQDKKASNFISRQVPTSRKPVAKAPAHRDQPRQQPQARPQASQPARAKQDDRAQWKGHDQRKDHDARPRQDRGRPQRPIQIVNFINFVPDVYAQDSVDDNAGTTGMLVNSSPQPLAGSAGYLSVYINGGTYFYYQGSFFMLTSSGYETVDPSTLAADGVFNIEIPNSSGAYTQIQLEAVNNGYVGPQGEFYPQFPSIPQLQAIYVR